MQAYAFIVVVASLLLPLFHSCHSTKAFTLYVGDSLQFKRGEDLQNLYLFHHRRVFDLCMFDQATLIYNGTSTHFTWRASRPGYYYFATRPGGSPASCNEDEKVAVRVITPDPSPEFPTLPSPSPVPGADFPPSHSVSGYPSPSPGSAPSAGKDDDDFGPLLPRDHHQELQAPPATAPSGPLEGSVPFISSNPAVPLPMGEKDTITILPTPTSGAENHVAGSSASSQIGIQVLFLVFSLCSSFLVY